MAKCKVLRERLHHLTTRHYAGNNTLHKINDDDENLFIVPSGVTSATHFATPEDLPQPVQQQVDEREATQATDHHIGDYRRYSTSPRYSP